MIELLLALAVWISLGALAALGMGRASAIGAPASVRSAPVPSSRR